MRKFMATNIKWSLSRVVIFGFKRTIMLGHILATEGKYRNGRFHFY